MICNIVEAFGKRRTKAEMDTVIYWFTGYLQKQLEQ
jgi:hypothetical protein